MSGVNTDLMQPASPMNTSGQTMNRASDRASQDAAMRKGNLRLALILASIALVFFVGFIAKMVMLSHR